jgi:galactose mutarotase-like enzyme
MFDLSDTAPEKRIVELLDPDEKFGVRVRFPDYPHLGVWSDAKAPFICIEPWQGMDDSAVQEPFDQKFGMLLLPPGEQRTFQASLEIIEK